MGVGRGYTLLGHADLDHFQNQNFDYNNIYENASKYLSRTKFENIRSDLKDALPELKNILKKQKKMTRSDRRDPKAKLAPDHCITERCIETGQQVCALGIYSSKDGALILDKEMEGFMSQLIPGDASQALRLLKKKKYILFFVALGVFLISHGIIYFIMRTFVENPLL